MVQVTTVPDEATRSLPMPDQIMHLNDEDLVELAEDLFDLLPDPKETLGDYSHDMGIVTALLEPYISTHLGKDQVRPLLQCVDPMNYSRALAENFRNALPFILRLVQHNHQELAKQRERMKQLERMSFLAVCKSGDEGENPEPSSIPLADKNGKTGSPPSSPDSSSKIKARRSTSPFPSNVSPTSPARRAKMASDSNARGDKSKLSRRPSFMSADPGSVAEIAKLRASSVSRSSGNKSSPAEPAPILKYEQLVGVKSIFKEADLNGDGAVTWEELRAHAPGLPEDPDEVMMGVDAEACVSISLLIRIVYPGVSPEQAKQYEEDLNKTFVLPEVKRQGIAELFCHMGGISKRESMEPLKLYLGLRQSLHLDHTESGKAYWHMLVAADRNSPANKGKVTLQQFTDWYVGNILTEKFKYDHTT